MTISIFVFAAATCLILVFISAPYGRHTRKGWGPSLPSRWGWILMETPPVVGFVFFYSWGVRRMEWVPLVFLGIWLFHYVHRAYIFPWRMRVEGKTMPILIIVLGMLFNAPNAYVNGRWVSSLWANYTMAWLSDPRFIVGCIVFMLGFIINIQSDSILLNLRKPGEKGYKIPHGGLYKWVSSPNYLGEIIEWIGWAIATWSVAGLAFAVYTIANLAPRAYTHHQWYQSTFSEYPKERKALIPKIW